MKANHILCFKCNISANFQPWLHIGISRGAFKSPDVQAATPDQFRLLGGGTWASVVLEAPQVVLVCSQVCEPLH